MKANTLNFIDKDEYKKQADDWKNFSDKIKNKYRWRIIMKCKVTSRVLDIINFCLEDEKIKKSKDTSIVIDINPSTMS